MVLESVLVSFFYKWLTSFPAPFVKEIVFNALYILASFVEDNRCVDLSILWAFYFVPLIYISVFVPVPYCLDDCGFLVEPEVRQVDSSNSIQCMAKPIQYCKIKKKKSKKKPLVDSCQCMAKLIQYCKEK